MHGKNETRGTESEGTSTATAGRPTQPATVGVTRTASGSWRSGGIRDGYIGNHPERAARWGVAIVVASMLLGHGATIPATLAESETTFVPVTHVVTAGTATIAFDGSALVPLGVSHVATTHDAHFVDPSRVDLLLLSEGVLETASDQVGYRGVVGGRLSFLGTLVFSHRDRHVVIEGPTVEGHIDRRWAVGSRALPVASGQSAIAGRRNDVGGFHAGVAGLSPGAPPEQSGLVLTDVIIDFVRGGDTAVLIADLAFDDRSAAVLHLPELAGVAIGTITIEVAVGAASDAGPLSSDTRVLDARPLALGAGAPAVGGPVAGTMSVGPDVIVGDVSAINAYGTLGLIAAFSIGTTSCNIGDTPLSWFSGTNQHPAIAQNMYRLKDGRFEHIGMSWVKHGFAALTGNLCSTGCVEPPGGQQQLGVGCSDPYSATLNGNPSHLGPRSDINVFTGFFPFPYSAPVPEPIIGRRLQVRESYLSLASNVGARYFAEAHYVTPDDAAAGNQNNNASYREMSISGTSGAFLGDVVGFTQRQKPAIRAWSDNDPGVAVDGVSVLADGVFWLGHKATDLGNGMWHYEYALQNLTSHRSARSFSIPIAPGATVENIGFHDVDYHSGEPYSLTDWAVSTTGGVVVGGEITWTTDAFNFDPNANALRWGTLYNFRFDADTAPVSGEATIGLFRPGSPPDVTVMATVPSAPVPICGDNFLGIGEECDPPDGVSCDANCQWVCGDGMVQAGETCDPPDGVTCDGNCQIIYICGDGVVDPGEDCDPPNGVTCDPGCLRIPICGDSILDPGEQCDPPNNVTCDDACQSISNDLCANAVAICPGAYDASTVGATNDEMVFCGDSANAPDVWFSFAPLSDGVLTVSTCGSVLDTSVSIHSACDAGFAGVIACNDDACGEQSVASTPVSAGVTYLIRVAGQGLSSGNFRVTVDGPPCLTGPSVSDACVFMLPVDEGGTPFTTLQNTTDGPSEPTACAAEGIVQIDGDAWFCYQPSCTGSAVISVCGADFDTAIAVYDQCECPTADSAIACSDDACGMQSEVTIPVVAGDRRLIRVGGANGASGTGTLAVTCLGTGDPIRGGQLYDNWWDTNFIAAPAGEHPLYPAFGQQQESSTFRCKECHGWDYKGRDGAYGSGPNFTDIGGVFGSLLGDTAMFDLIRSTAVANGHGFEDLGLTHQDTWDLVAFIQTLTIETDVYIDPGAVFLGDAVQGQVNFENSPTFACAFCHGVDGTALNFGSPTDPEWVGTIATYNPWELLHKIRFGQPASPMPSWIVNGGSDQGAADIGRYAQLNFPVDCTSVIHCEDGLFCTGTESCIDGFCLAGNVPCTGLVCDEAVPGCLTGLCDPPIAVAVGSRYVSVTPPPGNQPVALWVGGDRDDPNVTCFTKYVQANGSLGDVPVFMLPVDWGTVDVSDAGIIPETMYGFRTDCGDAIIADLSVATDVLTWRFGDVNADGASNFADIFLEVLGFQGNFDNAAFQALDIDPCTPNQTVNFADVFTTVLGFQNQTFANSCGIPCP